jgi:hypothetical protein
MNNKTLLKKVANLESKLDFYETEFENLNILLKSCGFTDGIKTLKESAFELLEDYREIIPEIKERQTFDY